MTDNRTTVGINLDDAVLFQLMILAHERDITLNKLVENILREYIDNSKLDYQLTG